MLQTYNLLASLFTVFVNSVYLEPRATKVLLSRMCCIYIKSDMADDEDLATQIAILSAIQESRDEEERVAEEERQRTSQERTSVPASLPTPTPVSTPSTHGSNTTDILTSSQTQPLSEEGATQFAGGTSGTKNLLNHLTTCKRRWNQDIPSCLIKQKQIMAQKKDGSMNLKNFNFDPEVSRRDFAEAIIFHEYPLAMADHIKFRKFISNLQPLFKMVTRNTINSDILKIHETATESFKKLLATNTGRIAITTDMWTSRKKKGYMSLTAHFIDDNWRLQSLLLRFLYVPTPHTMDVLADTLLKGLMSWNLEAKLSTITVDNCSTNDATPSRLEKFQDMAKQLKITCNKKLPIDCKTRWNSTYLMLQVALEYKDVFSRLRLRERNYLKAPTNEEWDMARIICGKLKLFHNITELFSGRKYPTANVYFVKICELREALGKWMESTDATIKDMATKMLSKFDKYWGVASIVMAVAVILDPRYKLKVVEYYFPRIYKDQSSHYIEEVRNIMNELLQEYQANHNTSESSSHISASASASESALNLDGDKGIDEESGMANLVQFLHSSSSSSTVKFELDRYFEEANLPWSPDFDILNWWKINGITYPTLQAIARDFLAIPVSTVASESTFSTSGRVVSPHRSSLEDDILEALMSLTTLKPSVILTWLDDEDDHDSSIAIEPWKHHHQATIEGHQSTSTKHRRFLFLKLSFCWEGVCVLARDRAVCVHSRGRDGEEDDIRSDYKTPSSAFLCYPSPYALSSFRILKRKIWTCSLLPWSCREWDFGE
ncbi:putative AC transposase [Senna tora]|uniref:Putative AC transposase n=1 Tax=Senna tora TaxID=362788 RepID=A0A834TVU9_9FABA|nr:putative AC transposase [Senna tora]